MQMNGTARHAAVTTITRKDRSEFLSSLKAALPHVLRGYSPCFSTELVRTGCCELDGLLARAPLEHKPGPRRRQTGTAHLLLPRARGGVAPGTCLCPEGALEPGAGRAVRVGFSQLKQMSERALKKIEEERRVAPFTSFEDFYLRTRVEYPVAENLIRIGAFDSVEPDRTELLWRLPLLHDRLSALASAGGGNSGQLRAFFAAPEQAGLEHEWTIEDRVRSELELLGLTVTCHPLALYEPALTRLGVTPSWQLPQLGDEVPVLVAGVYERAQNPWMRSGKRTMFLTLEDAYGLFECVLFESRLPACAPVVARATYFLVRGRLQNNRKRGLAVVVEDIWDLEEVLAEEAEREGAVKINPVARGRREEEVYGDGFV